jgi:hypothetical protein
MNLNIRQRAFYKICDLFSPPHSILEYQQILQQAREQAYRFYTLQAFLNADLKPDEAFIILRHDMDSDPRAALLFAAVEQQHKVQASYFFRRITWDSRVMSILHRRGHEVGYHYEELSDYAKAHHIKDKAGLLRHLPAIRREFAENIGKLRKTLDFDISTVAAHGDFTYPRLDIGNRYFLQDEQFRTQMGLLYEAYDEPLVAKYRNHVSDEQSPLRYYPVSPQELIAQRESFLFLSHPRWWIPNPIGNIGSDLRANYQKLRW